MTHNHGNFKTRNAEIIKRARSGDSYAGLAIAFRLSETTVRKICVDAGLPRRASAEWTPQDELRLTELYFNFSAAELAKIFKTSRNAIIGKANRLRLRKKHVRTARAAA